MRGKKKSYHQTTTTATKTQLLSLWKEVRFCWFCRWNKMEWKTQITVSSFQYFSLSVNIKKITEEVERQEVRECGRQEVRKDKRTCSSQKRQWVSDVAAMSFQILGNSKILRCHFHKTLAFFIIVIQKAVDLLKLISEIVKSWPP